MRKGMRTMAMLPAADFLLLAKKNGVGRDKITPPPWQGLAVGRLTLLQGNGQVPIGEA